MIFKQTVPAIFDIIFNKNVDVKRMKKIFSYYDDGVEFSEALILSLQQAQFGMSISPVVNKFLTTCLKEFSDHQIDNMSVFFRSMFTSLRTWTPSKGVLKLLRKHKIFVDYVNYIDYKLYGNTSVNFNIKEMKRTYTYIWIKSKKDRFPERFHINYNLMDDQLIGSNFTVKLLRVVYDYSVKKTRYHIEQVESVIDLIKATVPPKKTIVQEIFDQYNKDVVKLIKNYVLNNSNLPEDRLEEDVAYYLRKYTQKE